MSTPSPSPSSSPSPSPSRSPPPLSSDAKPTATIPVSAKKPQPVPWTDSETLHLIQSYQEKWYSLKRGQLKATQWEEVAISLAARCGYDYHPCKTAIQCRHKMEKLRRRYREEKETISLGGSSTWPFFDPMHGLEHGPLPLPISARPLPQVIPRRAMMEEEEDDENEEEEEEEAYGYRRNRSRSINYIIRKPGAVNRFSGRDDSGFLQGKRKRVEMKEEAEKVKEEEEGRGLAREIRAFSERILRMERRKMEMVRETERWKLEMENKRMGMILDSQRKIVEMIAAAAAAAAGSGSRVVDEF